MSDDNPSIMSHFLWGQMILKKAIAFYDAVMPTIGATRVYEHEFAIAYGKAYPEFWVQTPENDEPAQIANGTHYGFVAASKQEVHAFLG